jgi:cell wall-associated NlpC family hydrolase
VQEASRTIELPVYEGRVRDILQAATSLVGHPYVWGGMSERPQVLFGKQVPGGFDCSGFVWRVYKSFPDLAPALRGRTSMAMSGEVPKAQRVAAAELEAGDVLFFGAKGPKSKPAQVDHMGIYLGAGWMLHSSGYGVALVQLTGWYAERFAWGRRPLAELGV